MNTILGHHIFALRKKKGLTQNELAAILGVSFQAISKWETNVSSPDISLLPLIANALDCSIDTLLGYSAEQKKITDYENRYMSDDYYWGIKPSDMCYEVMKRLPPERPIKLLDIGCGEGKDAVFFARNGYIVTAIDISEAGLNKGKKLAKQYGVDVNFICADIRNFRLESNFDIVFSSGVLHYIPQESKNEIMSNYIIHTNSGGLHAMNVFVEKPFIPTPPDSESGEVNWKSGELMGFYSDWLIDGCDEIIFDCMSSGIPHKHCMDIVYAFKKEI